ncbi:hypothetical protein FHS27_001231 [Rhodopirellula rubra]|uniref:Uncharacterized protein n=1 Tax=Aporhodopirellula rubra TaxID=980271 RepID=A0A7W5H528_9BACT|nr:hypothetical protein [Aporhodopirellula rubra]MBB3205431.1 hypothetical protein [Aporhodopirellula rubra]
MALNETQKTAIANLRTEMQKLDPDAYQRIREDFYRIADNLKPLADALEMADADLGAKAGPLLDEHYIFAQMYDLLRKSNLGGVV